MHKFYFFAKKDFTKGKKYNMILYNDSQLRFHLLLDFYDKPLDMVLQI